LHREKVVTVDEAILPRTFWDFCASRFVRRVARKFAQKVVIVRLLRGYDKFIRLKADPGPIRFREAFENPVSLTAAISDDFR